MEAFQNSQPQLPIALRTDPTENLEGEETEGGIWMNYLKHDRG